MWGIKIIACDRTYLCFYFIIKRPVDTRSVCISDISPFFECRSFIADSLNRYYVRQFFLFPVTETDNMIASGNVIASAEK